MVNKELNKIMYEWGNIIAFLNVLVDYCEYNMDSKQIGYVHCLLKILCFESEKLHNELDVIQLETFDFEENNLK